MHPLKRHPASASVTRPHGQLDQQPRLRPVRDAAPARRGVPIDSGRSIESTCRASPPPGATCSRQGPLLDPGPQPAGPGPGAMEEGRPRGPFLRGSLRSADFANIAVFALLSTRKRFKTLFACRGKPLLDSTDSRSSSPRAESPARSISPSSSCSTLSRPRTETPHARASRCKGLALAPDIARPPREGLNSE